ncbi:hypothetical protein IKW75_00760 [Candidatus Saccharibacteria bacterium]|nr:hypothetical protein [Candidatus Saccharibacteria bacterium]
MEKRIKKYEEFIKKAAEHPTPELRAYHAEMVRNFQHERAVHLAIMLFFVALTLIFGGLTALAFATVGGTLAITTSVLAALLFILSFFYIRHYYFLENHIQRLYDVTTKLYK